jgi:hypothetical protein
MMNVWSVSGDYLEVVAVVVGGDDDGVVVADDV